MTNRQVLSALAFMGRSDVRIVHADIKPENIMLIAPPVAMPKNAPWWHSNLKVKLIDLGSGFFHSHEQVGSAGRSYGDDDDDIGIVTRMAQPNNFDHSFLTPLSLVAPSHLPLQHLNW